MNNRLHFNFHPIITYIHRKSLILIANITMIFPTLADATAACNTEHFKWWVASVVVALLYGIYVYKLKFYVVKMKGNYNHRLKNIGPTLPPFPNSWFVACHSK